MAISSWLRPAPRRNTLRPRLCLERLEDRSVPSTDLTGQGVPVKAVEATPFRGVQVARFHDPLSPDGQAEPASEFKANIEWGDGSAPSSGVVKLLGASGDYAVLGSHTFPEDTVTPYKITVTITDSPDTLTLTTRAVVAEGPRGDNDLSGKAAPIRGTEGVPIQGIQLASFHDPVSHGGKPDPASEFKVTIDWGDGTATSTGQVKVVGSGGDYAVLGSHTFPEDTITAYKITVTISDPSESSTQPPAKLVLTTTATVAEGPAGDNDLTGQGVPVPIPATAGVPLFAYLGKFHDPVSNGGQPDPATEFTATIDWGDGTPTTSGTVELVNPNGEYVVLGMHTYLQGSPTAPFKITVTITDPSEAAGIPPATLTLTTTAVVAPPT